MLSELFEAGGVVMAPIAVASVAAWWLALAAGLRMRRLTCDLRATRGLFEESPAGSAPSAATSVRGRSTATLELAADDLAGLGQDLRFLGVLVGILPLLGLLGTVSGMIGTFGIIQLGGMGDPRLLAGGIREALFATEAGLATALPALLLHQVLAARLRRAGLEEELLLRRLARVLPGEGARERAGAGSGGRFGELAARLGYVRPADVERCLALAREREARVGEVLLAQGCLSALQRRIVLALQGVRHD
ncbi:MAG: MotA/TolQ/ExbB proton channel family protein [Planctomycetes bacterium]|nr:MotA/TolQ/ExbB proton channel family protein [Planctomycetota bacterium]